ncbi:hypothetical protein SLH49_07775 [Cognatiyoonia sp. IB215446]|uniref:hypothetical protein n=1 Tax=Cognatiyoonia sp. IB215446 TaxID=3097355 RepID=UPI002A1812A3|nr:hypothetical protein [Cognatiyoonia sp. IB215446]MDX8347881.1 hypothetical protein [Cognatiyoonia sp. IB215446]
MSTDQPSFEDWVNAVTRPVIGLLLGLVAGEVIKLAIGGSIWLAVITAVICAAIWFGLLFLEKLNIRVSTWLFGGSGVQPARLRRKRAPGTSWPARVGRYGLAGGMLVGCLTALVLPQSPLVLLV